MRTIFAIFSLLILVGCGKNYDPDLNRPHVNKDLQIYVNRFVQIAEELGRPVSLGRLQVEFVPNMEGNVIGKCYYGYVGRKIEINKSYWDRSDVYNSDRESLMFHELGHCILDRGHDNNYLPYTHYGYSLKKSIMHSVHFYYASEYEYNWEYYIRELFGLPIYISQAGTSSQFPGEFYDNPSLVPIPSENVIYCKPGVECSTLSYKVFSVTEDDFDGSFHCGESHEH